MPINLFDSPLLLREEQQARENQREKTAEQKRNIIDIKQCYFNHISLPIAQVIIDNVFIFNVVITIPDAADSYRYSYGYFYKPNFASAPEVIRHYAPCIILRHLSQKIELLALPTYIQQDNVVNRIYNFPDQRNALIRVV